MAEHLAFSTSPLVAAMNSPPAVNPSPCLESCDAVIIALQSRRYVVVYRDRPIVIWPMDRICRSIRTLRPGDKVRYKGKTDIVQVMKVY